MRVLMCACELEDELSVCCVVMLEDKLRTHDADMSPAVTNGHDAADSEAFCDVAGQSRSKYSNLRLIFSVVSTVSQLMLICLSFLHVA